MHKTTFLKIFSLLFVVVAGINRLSAQNTILSENIQSWTNHTSYGSYTQSVVVGTGTGTVSMINCIVANNAAATGTGSRGRVQLKASTGMLQLPVFTTVSIVEFHLAAGSTGRTVKLQSYNGSVWSDVTTFQNIGTTGTTFTYTINSSAATTLRLASPNNAVYVHDIIVKDYNSTVPAITVSTETMSGFTYNFGNGTSGERTFTISGANLSAGISIEPPAGYEISTTTGDAFRSVNPLLLAPGSGSVPLTTVYVRLSAGLAVGNYTGDINMTAEGATPKKVSLVGNVTCTPSNLAFAEAEVNKIVADGHFTLTATTLNTAAPISYYSSAASVATVDVSTGEVTIIGAGSTKISAMQAEANGFCATTVSYDLNVGAQAATLSIVDITNPSFSSTVGENDSQLINVSGLNLTAPICLSVTGADASQFTLSQAAIDPVGGEAPLTSVDIRYTPTTAGSHKAFLALTTLGSIDVVVSISGNAALLSGFTTPSELFNPVVRDGKIIFDAVEGETIEIFNAVGQKLIQKTAECGSNTIELPVRGVVLVRSGNHVAKVIL